MAPGAMSRRRFLVGAGAVVAAGAAGFGVLDLADHSLVQKGLHRVGLASSPDRAFPPSGASERSGTFLSRSMGRGVGWTIAHPAGSGPVDGVIVGLHGYHDDHRFVFDQIRLPDAAAAVGLRVAIAAVDGGSDSYWHRRADGTDAMSMLLDEFLPLVRGAVGAVPRAVMGWSMGGYGALLAAERAPAAFRAVAPASPALWLTPGATAPGAFDSPADYYANDVFRGLARLDGLVVAVACGTGDPFYSATRQLVADMRFPHTATFGPGYHDPSYWRHALPGQLAVIGPALTRPA